MAGAALVAIAVVASSLALGAQSGPPRTIARFGSSALVLVGHATRSRLAGVDDMYSIALYAPAPFSREALVSEDTATALRIEIAYERDWHRPAAVAWHRELLPRLEPAAVGHLDRAFAPLRRGDIVLIEYSPRTGTMVRINSIIAVFGARHDLMLAFLDHWLGQRPVSEEVKRALLGHL
jgi:hypothetical protein